MNQIIETNITIGLRRNLIEEIKQLFELKKYQNYGRVLEAMREVPRHFFAPVGFDKMAYENQPMYIDEKQTISTPNTVAIQTYLLDIKPTDRILEIGTGSGYQASILGFLAAEVYSLERFKVLHDKAGDVIRKLGMTNIKMYLKDGFEGLESEAPFDKIIITCAAPEIPQNLIAQLKVGGIIVLPKDDGEGEQDMLRLVKNEDGSLEEEIFGKFKFVPMLTGINKKI